MSVEPDPTDPFVNIWDWFYEGARDMGMDVDDAERYADEMAMEYAR